MRANKPHARLEELIQNGDHDSAVNWFRDEISRREFCPSELVLMARCIQLSSENSSMSLTDAKNALLQACVRDPDYVPAVLELGWFAYAVDNDVVAAQSLFRRAYDISASNLTESIIGRARCIAEVSGPADALQYLEFAGKDAIDRSRIEAEMQKFSE